MAETDADLRDLARAICAHPPSFFSLDELHDGARRATDDPATVTDRQLQHMACYEPGRILGLVRKREAARQADRDAAEQRRVAAEAAAAAAASEPASIDLERLTFEDLVAKYPAEPTPLGLFGDLRAFVVQINERNQERNAKIAALEQRAADLTKQLTDLRVELDAWIQVRS